MPASQPKPKNVAVVLQAEKLVRRQPTDQQLEVSLARRRAGAIAMSCVGIATLLQRRSNYDSVAFMIFEAATCLGAILLASWFYRRSTTAIEQQRESPRKQVATSATSGWVSCLLLLAMTAPWIINGVAKRNAAGNGMEIVMLCTLGWASFATALVGSASRLVSLSVVCSGFVALFGTLISDTNTATWFAYAWVALCVWWLVGNHWEGLESQTAHHVERAIGLRWGYIALAVCLFAVSLWTLGDRVPVLSKLQAELMPTSGGTSLKDSAASSGVGNGDALVAAQHHATSFGAVETDQFLDSEKPSLFDVFSDEFGDLKRSTRFEQAQALSPENLQSESGKFSEANRSSSENQFGIERERPERKPTPDDLASNALFFWQGRAHAHLAVERFDHFDGVNWQARSSPEAAEKEGTPGEIVIDEQSWFFAPGNKFTKSLSPYRGAVAEAVKFTRYGSAIIPSRCGTIMWSVDRLNRRDFFRYDPADCLSMPGREQVPDYTVVRFVNGEIDLERMAQLLEHCSPGKGHVLGTQKCTEEIAALAHVFAGSNARGWEQIDSLLQRLRQEFRHDSGERDNRESGTSHESSPAALGQSAHGQSALERFLQQREGPSYLFATTAALMLEHLGYETRLVTGFYVSREHYIARDQNYAVLPQDAHVWLEVNAGHGYWIPLEPTPGYRPPRYAASAWYRIRQAGPQLAIAVGVLALAALLVSWCKSLLFDAACWLVAPLLTLADDRRRVRWTAWVLDQRLSLLGDRRPNGIVLREHLKTSLHLPEHWNSQLRNLLDACDGLIFGKNHGLSVEQRASMHAVWKQLSTRQMRSLRVRENG